MPVPIDYTIQKLVSYILVGTAATVCVQFCCVVSLCILVTAVYIRVLVFVGMYRHNKLFIAALLL